MKWIASIVVALVLCGLLPSCAQVLYAPQYQKGTVSHVAILYLKNHGDAGDRQKIIEATRELRTIPGVYDLEVGTVLASDRPIVVSDYDLGIVVTFRDEASMRAYLTHPKHQKAVKEVLTPLTSKIVVYDFVNQEY